MIQKIKNYNLTKQPVSIYGFRKLGAKTYFYIGSTKEPVEVRAMRHLRQAKKGIHENKRLANVLLTNNFQVDTLEIVNEYNRWEKELYWILKSVKAKHKLLNSRNPIRPREPLSTLISKNAKEKRRSNHGKQTKSSKS